MWRAALSTGLLLSPPLSSRAVWRSTRALLASSAAPSAGELSIDAAEPRCSPEPERFVELRDETVQLWPGGAHMVSGAQQGRLLHMLVRLSRASRVLEVGCFSGYAALWMALALPPGGTLLSLERDERAAEVARRHLAASGMGERVELRIGDAMDSLLALPADEPPFELIFLDADKKRSWAYVDLLMSRGLLAPHGLLLVDNVLWKGQVLAHLDPQVVTAASDAAATLPSATRRSMGLRDALHAFSTQLAVDERVHQVLLPLRDGLTWVQAPPPELATAPPSHQLATAPPSRLREDKCEESDLGKSSDNNRLASYLRLVSSGEPALMRAAPDAAGELLTGDRATAIRGVQQGRLLHMLVRLSRASRVLEVGCFSGYAALWMALALPPGGTLLSLERDERAAEVARRHLAASGMGERVELRIGDAMDSLLALPADEPPFELIVCSTVTSRVESSQVKSTVAAGELGEADGAADALSEEMLAELLARLAGHGLLVTVHPRPTGCSAEEAVAAVAAGVDAVRGAAQRADPRVQAVTLPSPDGDGGLCCLLGLQRAP